MLDLMKKNEKLKMKLQQEKKIAHSCFFLFVISWVSTIIMVFMLLFKVNCNVWDYCSEKCFVVVIMILLEL